MENILRIKYLIKEIKSIIKLNQNSINKNELYYESTGDFTYKLLSRNNDMIIDLLNKQLCELTVLYDEMTKDFDDDMKRRLSLND